MYKLHLHLLLLAFILFLAGCENSSPLKKEAEESAGATISELVEVPPTTASPANIQLETRKLINEGRVTFETSDLQETRKRINEGIRANAAYVAYENENKYDDRIAQELTIRVPSKNFDKLLDDITAGVEIFDEKNIQVRDVTSEFVDITARLKTKKELEQRYMELLKKASTVKEMLEIERELGNLRAEIESVEGRLRLLTNQVDYSTLTVYYYQTVAGQTQFGNEIRDGFYNGWQSLILFFIGLINIWPFILLMVAGFILTRRLIKRKKGIATKA